MKALIIFIISFSFCTETFKKLYGTTTVLTETKVYLDIKKYKVGQKIIFEFKFPDEDERFSSYSFKIGQTTSEDYKDLDIWNALKTKNSKCGAEKDFQCFYEWTETKLENSTYIFIIPLKPSNGYNTYVEIHYTTNKTRDILIALVLVALIFGIPIYFAFTKKGKRCCCSNIRRRKKNELLLHNNNSNQKKCKNTPLHTLEYSPNNTPGYPPQNEPENTPEFKTEDTPEYAPGYTPGYTSY